MTPQKFTKFKTVVLLITNFSLCEYITLGGYLQSTTLLPEAQATPPVHTEQRDSLCQHAIHANLLSSTNENSFDLDSGDNTQVLPDRHVPLALVATY